MKALNALQGDDIQTKAFVISTGEALRAFLQVRPEIVSLRRAINTGEVTWTDIKGYVSELIRSFCAGKKFVDEISLAAIAVTVETLPGTFAEEYLEDLASLQIQELPLATRVARLCLSGRRKVVTGRTDRSIFFHMPISEKVREVEPVRITSGNARHDTQTENWAA